MCSLCTRLVYFKGHEQNSCALGQTTAFAVSKFQITTAPAGRDNEISLSDLFRAETFVKERERPEEEHFVDWPILVGNVRPTVSYC